MVDWRILKAEVYQEQKMSKEELVDGIHTCEEGLILHPRYERFSNAMSRYSELGEMVSKLNAAQRVLVVNGRYTSDQLQQILEMKDRAFAERNPLWHDILDMNKSLREELDCPVSPKQIIEYRREVDKLRNRGSSRPEEKAIETVFRNKFNTNAKRAERSVKARYGM